MRSFVNFDINEIKINMYIFSGMWDTTCAEAHTNKQYHLYNFRKINLSEFVITFKKKKKLKLVFRKYAIP